MIKKKKLKDSDLLSYFSSVFNKEMIFFRTLVKDNFTTSLLFTTLTSLCSSNSRNSNDSAYKHPHTLQNDMGKLLKI